MALNKLIPQRHNAVFGGTGSGKSYTASELHSEVPKSVYFNYPQKEADEYEIAGLEADGKTSYSGMKKALKQGKKLKYKPHWKPEVADSELRQLYENVLKPSKGTVDLFVDEAHLFDEGLLYVLRDGRGHNVRVHVITQRPKDLDTTAISQIDQFLIYRLAPQQKTWFSQMNMPFSQIKEWTSSKDYRFVIWKQDQEGFTKCEPIPYNP